ncbi:PKD domain-containing protein [Natrarchaeobius oligotrophus]|uniref:PKD domain-containing protein n=1 Tax=Natrarchaeobius chitinivorans TaxID=1679083 RepID=A0A3N6MW98_NATCH|nr:PKD domain-containing protein [Natrarchaeobius chitinivorans]RQG99216.1 PKD domain-containing protein [Natrarchaeobius chitinivorans]
MQASLASVGTLGVAATSSVQATGESVSATNVDPDYSVFNDRGLWDWVPYTIIADGETVMDGYDGRWELFFDKAEAHSIGTFYPHYSDPTADEPLEEPVREAPDEDVERFLRVCHDWGIQVEPLVGGGVAGWVAAEAWPQAESILEWNGNHPPEERFDGIHINVENGDRYDVKPEILDRLDDAPDDLIVSMSQDPMWARNTDDDRVREVMEHRNLDYYCTMVYDLDMEHFWPNLGRVTQPYDTPFALGQGINEHGHPNRNWDDADALYGWVEENWIEEGPPTDQQFIDEETGQKYLGLSIHSFWGLIDAPEVGDETNIGEPSREYRTDPAPGSGPDPDPDPVAVISASNDAVAPEETVTFDGGDSSAPEGEIVAYEWDLGDGTEVDGETVEHAYDAVDEYVVELTVTDDRGETDAATTTITVEEPDEKEPVAAFEVEPDDPVVGEEVAFDASASHAPAGEIVEYLWDYDLQPGLEERGETFTHVYESDDSYDVRLVVVDDEDREGETVQTVTVVEDDESEPEYPEWDPDEVYTSGDRVVHDGTVWEAQWWTRGDEPGDSEWGPWEEG